MAWRCASKITDRVSLTLAFLEEVVEKGDFKQLRLTWDRIDDTDDREPGVIVVPIIEIIR